MSTPDPEDYIEIETPGGTPQKSDVKNEDANSLFSRIVPKDKLWQYSRMCQWFFAFPRMAQLLLHDGFGGQLDRCVDMTRLEVGNPDKQDAMGRHRIEDLHYKIPLILTPKTLEKMRERIGRLGLKNAQLPSQAHIAVLCEHKHGVNYDIYRQGFEQVAAEVVENMRRTHQTDSLFPFLEPVLILFCIHGPVEFPLLGDLQDLFFKTGDSFIDNAQPSVRFRWFNLNALDDCRLFDGTNPVEYDSVLNVLKGADCGNFPERLETSLDKMRPRSDNPWITACADKILLFAASLKDRIDPKELNRISSSFQPIIGGESMESKTILEQIADMYAEEYQQKYLLEGRREGRQEGRQEGRLEVWAKSILNLLTRRFGPVSDEVRQAINGIHDEPVLESYYNLAFDCQSLEEFEKDLLQ